MADLRISRDMLHETSESLAAIHHALEDLKKRTSSTEGDWGSSALADAMGHFSGGWDSHRAKILTSVETIRGLVEQTVTGFDDTEHKLARSLHTQTRHATVHAE